MGGGNSLLYKRTQCDMDPLYVSELAAVANKRVKENPHLPAKFLTFVIIQTNMLEYEVPMITNEGRPEMKFRIPFVFVPRNVE